MIPFARLAFSIHKLDWWFHGLFINSARRSYSIRKKTTLMKSTNSLGRTTSFPCRARRSRAEHRSTRKAAPVQSRAQSVRVCHRLYYASVYVWVSNLSIKTLAKCRFTHAQRNFVTADSYNNYVLTYTHTYSCTHWGKHMCILLNGRALYNLQNWRLHLFFLPIPFFLSHAVTHNVTYLSTRAHMSVCVCERVCVAFVVVLSA